MTTKKQPTPFEKAYIDLYNARITIDQFASAAGIPDDHEALRMLRAYREKILTGAALDPRDIYDDWRRNK